MPDQRKVNPRPAVTMARMDRLFRATMGNRASAGRSAPI